MSKTNHKRGSSQEIPRNFIMRDEHKNILDFRHSNALSSQHTRSTAFTTCKSKNNHQQVLKQGKTKKQSIKIHAFEWKQNDAPYTPEEVIKLYSRWLDASEKAQIMEYRNVWFIGSKQSKHKNQINEETTIKKGSQLDQQGFLKYEIGNHVGYRYEILEKINRGSFGEVFKVYDHKTKQLQALKIVKKMPELVKQTFIEISILTNIKEKDRSDMSGIIRIKDFTIFRDFICIAFELMDANLFDLLHANEFRGLSQSYVRIFSIQMLNSLNFLSTMKIIHCDIKPENFVLKTWGKSGIKLIDFGTSCYQDQQVYTYIQSRYYRAPQILFHRPYSPAIDMWSLACLIAELSLGRPLFPGSNDLHQLLYIINLIGYPSEQFSHRCSAEIQRIKQRKYLDRDQFGKIMKQSIDRFEQDTGLKLDIESLKPLQQRLQGALFPLVHFLKQILKWDPRDRITPAEALQHPWVTNGLPSQIHGIYTIYQNLNNNESKQDKSKKGKNQKRKSKSKSKSKSRDKSQQDQSENKLIKPIKVPKNLINFGKAQSKVLKFDLPVPLITMKSKTSRGSQQKSRTQKTSKSPRISKKPKA